MRLYRCADAIVLESEGRRVRLNDDWNQLINRAGLVDYLRERLNDAETVELMPPFLPPLQFEEVWAAGVTYLRSRTARIEESHDAGGGSFYDRVYSAERPELFFKAAGWRVRGAGAAVRIRRDAQWSVPEPELALHVSARGDVVGYSIGNDMSARDIEGQNPLYLPQAKIYDGSCALGPCMLVREAALPADTAIEMRITRAGATVFTGATSIAQMRRTPEELVGFLYRETSFPDGCVLLTGTGIVPPDDFTLHNGDEIRIEIAPIGVLTNQVEI